MNIGSTIYKLRTAKNLSQEELAEMLEVSRQSVSKWETDSATPDLDKLVKLCDIFGITLDELVGREMPEGEPTEQAAESPPQIIVQQVPVRYSALTASKISGIILILLALFAPILLYGLVSPNSAIRFAVTSTLPLAIEGALLLAEYRGAWLAFLPYWWKVHETQFMIGLWSRPDSIVLTIGLIILTALLHIATCIGIGLISRKYLSEVTLPDQWNQSILVILGWLAHLTSYLVYILDALIVIETDNTYLWLMLSTLTCVGMAFYTTCHLLNRKKHT